MPVRGKNAGNKGQGSKWISRTRRRKIYDRDDWKCVWCLKQVCDIPRCPKHSDMATLDHITPRSQGGSNESNNLITCCMFCNRLRGDSYWHSFAKLVAQAPWKYECVIMCPKGHELRILANIVRKRIRTVLNSHDDKRIRLPFQTGCRTVLRGEEQGYANGENGPQDSVDGSC